MILRPATLFGIVASIVGGVMLGVAAFWRTSDYRSEAARDERLLLSVLRKVSADYVDEVPRTQLVDNAIRGMVADLDDHSMFLDVRTLLEIEEEASGRFGGVGVELELVDGYITLSPLSDTPAARAGIVAGDRLIEVDHESLKGRTLMDAVHGLRGKPGTDVHLRIRRNADAKPKDFEIVRDTIAVPSVRGRWLAPGYAHVRVSQFNESTADDLADVVARLADEDAINGLVLDLRSNPGGLLEASAAVADAFLTGGLIVHTEARAADSTVAYNADASELISGKPLAVLVDGDSASASEVVAAALQDHGRALVVGTNSFGKGSVQSVVYFQDRRAIKLTTARYLTPSGQPIQSGGIEPDVVVAKAEGESRAAYDERLLAEALAQLKRPAEH